MPDYVLYDLYHLLNPDKLESNKVKHSKINFNNHIEVASVLTDGRL